MEIAKTRTWVGVVGLGLLVSGGAFGSEAIGIPDAPPAENLIAHDTYDFPSGFVTPDGRHFPGGAYALDLIQSGGRYYLRLTHVETRRGLRLEGRATARDRDGSVAEVSVRPEKSGKSLLFSCGDVTAAFPLQALRQAG